MDLQPYLVAVQYGQIAMVQALLAAGADPNHANSTGKTPIFFADTREVVEALVKAGVKVNHVGSQRITPLISAALGGHQKAVSALIAAATKEHLAIVKILLAAGANVDIPSLKPEVNSDIRNLLSLWQLKIENKDKSLCEQVLAVLSLSLDWSTSITLFFSKPEIINTLTNQKNNPRLNNNVKHLMNLLQKHQQQIPAVNFEFIMEFVLSKESKQVKVSIKSEQPGEQASSLPTL
jgi:hypothetical protein